MGSSDGAAHTETASLFTTQRPPPRLRAVRPSSFISSGDGGDAPSGGCDLWAPSPEPTGAPTTRGAADDDGDDGEGSSSPALLAAVVGGCLVGVACGSSRGAACVAAVPSIF